MVLPDALKAIKPYITLAGQLDQRNEKFVAYYCRLYSLQHGMSINKSAPECKKFLLNLMDLLESTKNQNRNEEAITSQVVGQALVEKLALNIFSKADMEDRESKFNKNLVKQFYTAGLLFDSLNYFGDLSEDLVTKKQYAKRKAMYLNRCFQTGEHPVPGPLLGDESGENEGDEEGASSDPNNLPTAPTNYPLPPTDNQTYYPPTNYPQVPQNNYNQNYIESPPNPKPRSIQQAPESHFSQEIVSSNDQTSSISPEELLKAQKLCKFATSALQYEDVPTAIKNLEDCLNLLKYRK